MIAPEKLRDPKTLPSSHDNSPRPARQHSGTRQPSARHTATLRDHQSPTARPTAARRHGGPPPRQFAAWPLLRASIVAFCVGALSVFFDVASPAYLPSLVPREGLAKANGRLQISEQGAAVFGPGLAGWLVGLIGAPVAIAADAVRLRSIAIAAAIINLFGRLMVVLVPLYLVREAGYRPVAIGVVFACGSVGFLLGAAIADKIAARVGLGRAILGGGTVAALALILIAAPPPQFAGPFIAAAMFVYGIGALTFTISNATWRQMVTPDEPLSRRPRCSLACLVHGSGCTRRSG